MVDLTEYDLDFVSFFTNWLRENDIPFQFNGNVFELQNFRICYLNEIPEMAECQEDDIKIWRDQWQKYPLIVLSRLKSLLGMNEKLPARVCKIRRIDQPTAFEFLNSNHLQQGVSSKLKYGLFLPKAYFRLLKRPVDSDCVELLVAVMTLSGPKKYYKADFITHSFELIRFANLLDMNVVGGFSKLLKFFLQEKKPGNIMTYVDADWSSGKNFENMGFELIEKTKPIYFDLNADNERVKTNLRKEAKVANSGSYKFIMSDFGKV